jgi:hypothetical protein
MKLELEIKKLCGDLIITNVFSTFYNQHSNWQVDFHKKVGESHLLLYMCVCMMHLELLKRLKCISQNEYTERRSWGMFPNSQHFRGKNGMLELQNGN